VVLPAYIFVSLICHVESHTHWSRVISCVCGGNLDKRMLDNIRGKEEITLSQAMRMQRGSRGITTLSLTLPLDGGEWSTPCPGCFTPGKEALVLIVQEAVWAPGSVWTDVENLASTSFWSPDHLAHSESLYWLLYPSPLIAGLWRTLVSCVYTLGYDWIPWIILFRIYYSTGICI